MSQCKSWSLHLPYPIHPHHPPMHPHHPVIHPHHPPMHPPLRSIHQRHQLIHLTINRHLQCIQHENHGCAQHHPPPDMCPHLQPIRRPPQLIRLKVVQWMMIMRQCQGAQAPYRGAPFALDQQVLIADSYRRKKCQRSPRPHRSPPRCSHWHPHPHMHMHMHGSQAQHPPIRLGGCCQWAPSVALSF